MLENTIHSIVGLARAEKALFTVTGISLGPFLHIDPFKVWESPLCLGFVPSLYGSKSNMYLSSDDDDELVLSLVSIAKSLNLSSSTSDDDDELLLLMVAIAKSLSY